MSRGLAPILYYSYWLIRLVLIMAQPVQLENCWEEQQWKSHGVAVPEASSPLIHKRALATVSQWTTRFTFFQKPIRFSAHYHPKCAIWKWLVGAAEKYSWQGSVRNFKLNSQRGLKELSPIGAPGSPSSYPLIRANSHHCNICAVWK